MARADTNVSSKVDCSQILAAIDRFWCNACENSTKRAQRKCVFTYLDVKADVIDNALAIVEINGELVQGEFLLEELAQVALQKVATQSLLDALAPVRD
jgi:hypothetical protein